jgi:hypothetical protein
MLLSNTPSCPAFSPPAGASTGSSCASSTSLPTAAPPNGSGSIAMMSPVGTPSSSAVGNPSPVQRWLSAGSHNSATTTHGMSLSERLRPSIFAALNTSGTLTPPLATQRLAPMLSAHARGGAHLASLTRTGCTSLVFFDCFSCRPTCPLRVTKFLQALLFVAGI